jgi:BirA family transcriptional regulator, biotin operon repressor / biotin---[acetyl-CoA-carboxylase] ligase
VIGTGVNVNHTPEELAGPFRYPATSVAAEAGGPVRRQELFLRFLEQFESIYDAFINTGFSAMLPEIERFSGILGKAVTVVCSDREIFGKAERFSAEGALVLLREDGNRETIWVGDVTRVEGVP